MSLRSALKELVDLQYSILYPTFRIKIFEVNLILKTAAQNGSFHHTHSRVIIITINLPKCIAKTLSSKLLTVESLFNAHLEAGTVSNLSFRIFNSYPRRPSFS